MLKRIVLVGILLGAVGVGAGAYYGSRDGQKASVATPVSYSRSASMRAGTISNRSPTMP